MLTELIGKDIVNEAKRLFIGNSESPAASKPLGQLMDYLMGINLATSQGGTTFAPWSISAIIGQRSEVSKLSAGSGAVSTVAGT